MKSEMFKSILDKALKGKFSLKFASGKELSFSLKSVEGNTLKLADKDKEFDFVVDKIEASGEEFFLIEAGQSEKKKKTKKKDETENKA